MESYLFEMGFSFGVLLYRLGEMLHEGVNIVNRVNSKRQNLILINSKNMVVLTYGHAGFLVFICIVETKLIDTDTHTR